MKPLQSALKNSSSSLYTSQASAVGKQLVACLDPNYSILSAPSGQRSSISSQNQNESSGSSKHSVRNTVIGVCTALGVLLLTATGVAGWCWRSRKHPKPDTRQHSGSGSAILATRPAANRRQTLGTIRSFSTRDVDAPSPRVGVHRAPTVRSFGLREHWELDPAEHDDLFGISPPPFPVIPRSAGHAAGQQYPERQGAPGQPVEEDGSAVPVTQASAVLDASTDLSDNWDDSSSIRAYAQAVEYAHVDVASPPVELATAPATMSHSTSFPGFEDPAHGDNPFSDPGRRASGESLIILHPEERVFQGMPQRAAPSSAPPLAPRHDPRVSHASEWTQPSAPHTPHIEHTSRLPNGSEPAD